jgi:MFS superfamily sulfate permease-like transporter
MLSLLFLTQLFFYIPKAALAAIIIAAVIFMVEVHVVIPMWKTKSEYTTNSIRHLWIYHKEFPQKVP